MFDEVVQKSHSKDEYIWAFKYAPKTLSDLIVLDKHEPTFERFVETKHIPDSLLYGPPGVGKTTIANLMIDLNKYDTLSINGSLNTSIDVVRSDIKNFTRRSSSSQKLVFIDELDRLSKNGQDALKAEIEACKKTTFIFTSNHIENIIDAIVSRCGGGMSFYFNGEEKKQLQKKYFKRCISILEQEEVEFEPKAIATVIQNFFPDMRNIIHNLQSVFNQYGKIELNSVQSLVSTDFDEFFKLIKTKDLGKIREFCTNLNSDYTFFYGSLVKKIEKYIQPESIGNVISSCYEHSKTSATSADKELALIHFCFTLLGERLK